MNIKTQNIDELVNQLVSRSCDVNGKISIKE